MVLSRKMLLTILLAAALLPVQAVRADMLTVNDALAGVDRKSVL